jgi:hypothetical protein
MAYREITVNNKTYQYVVGRDVTKIKGFGIFRNYEWAFTRNKDRSDYTVTPWHVEGMILGIQRQDRSPNPCITECINTW